MKQQDKDKLIEGIRYINSYIKILNEKIYLLNKTKRNLEEVLDNTPDEKARQKKLMEKIKQNENKR